MVIHDLWLYMTTFLVSLKRSGWSSVRARDGFKEYLGEWAKSLQDEWIAYADGEMNKLVLEFAIPGAPTETIDIKILKDSVHLLSACSKHPLTCLSFFSRQFSRRSSPTVTYFNAYPRRSFWHQVCRFRYALNSLRTYFSVKSGWEKYFNVPLIKESIKPFSSASFSRSSI